MTGGPTFLDGDDVLALHEAGLERLARGTGVVWPSTTLPLEDVARLSYSPMGDDEVKR